jgi:hypothetical protein
VTQRLKGANLKVGEYSMKSKSFLRVQAMLAVLVLAVSTGALAQALRS